MDRVHPEMLAAKPTKSRLSEPYKTRAPNAEFVGEELIESGVLNVRP